MAHCHSCEVLYINGLRCHEIGCPDRWKDEVRECKECGDEFKPEAQGQHFCSDDCAFAYVGLQRPDDDVDCPECKGSGYCGGYSCEVCWGTGIVLD